MSGVLNVVSYHEDALTDLHNESEGKSSICYLGKTFLPKEKLSIEKHLGLRPSTPAFDALFTHECLIESKKFLFLICGEFTHENGTAASLLNNSSSTSRYDFIVHSTVGGDIKYHQKLNAKYYIHSDYGADNKVEKNEGGNLVKLSPSQISEKRHYNLRQIDYQL